MAIFKNYSTDSINASATEVSFMETFMAEFLSQFASDHYDCFTEEMEVVDIPGYARDGYIPHTNGGLSSYIISDYTMPMSESAPASVKEEMYRLMKEAESDYCLDNGVKTIEEMGDMEDYNEYEYNYLENLHWYYQVRIYKDSDGINFDVCINFDEYGRENHNCLGNFSKVFPHISEKLTRENIVTIAEKVYEEFNSLVWKW